MGSYRIVGYAPLPDPCRPIKTLTPLYHLLLLLTMANQGQNPFPLGPHGPYGPLPPGGLFGPPPYPPPGLVPPGVAPLVPPGAAFGQAAPFGAAPPIPPGAAFGQAAPFGAAPPIPPGVAFGQAAPFGAAFPLVGGMPPPGFGARVGHHLQLTGGRDGILGRFSKDCPKTISELPDWIDKVMNAMRGARSGIRWIGQYHPHGAAPMQVDTTVPFTVVFTCPALAALRIPITDPVTGNLFHVSPPMDVVSELSTQVYTSIVNLIGFEQRKFYQGVAKNNGWQLIRHLRRCQANEGGQYEFLKAKRDSIKCAQFGDYPQFKTEVLQMKDDYAQAVRQGAINADEDWSLREAKIFVVDTLQPLLGSGLSEWNEDSANAGKDLDALFVKASSVYKVRYRQIALQKTQPVAYLNQSALPAQQDTQHDVDAFYSNSSPRDNGRGRDRNRDRNVYQDRGRDRDQGARNWNSRRADAGRYSQKGGKGGSIVAALIPVITAAITQAVSSGQAPYHQAPFRQPRPDNKRPRNSNRNRGAGRGMQQFYNDQGDYDEPEYPPCPADAPVHDHQYDDNHGQYGDFGASQ
jgi:hypothetical protein